MTARSVALGAAALVLAAACGSSQSKYMRQTAAPGELVWRFDDRLQVSRNGQVVAEDGGWSGLAAAVACVPRAKDWATAATARHRKGTVTLWAGLVGGLVSAVAGGALVFSDTNNDDRVLGGFSLMLGGLIFGTSAALTGVHTRQGASARGIDAVNLYNDEIASGARCAP